MLFHDKSFKDCYVIFTLVYIWYFDYLVYTEGGGGGGRTKNFSGI